MFKIFKIIILFLLFQAKSVLGQDMHFTQFYASPLYLNPAFTGANVCSRAILVYRNQWPEVKNAYQSYLLSIDHFISKQRIGVGLQCGVDNAGSGALRTTIISPSFAYETKINRTVAVRFGVQPGVTIKSIRFDKLIFGDQISQGGSSGPTAATIVETPTQNKAFFDIGAGALIYSSKLWAGASFFHINRPNESLFANENIYLPLKYSLHGGAKFNLNDGEKDKDLKKSISVVMNYTGQGKFDQIDLGVYYSQYVFTAGIWYRGIPGLKTYKPGYQNNDAISAVIGFQKDRLKIGYSYDLTISQLHNYTQGAHEVTLSYELCTPKKGVKRVLISCPKF
jgi:type IX secretion system PorP/SprF family membrane protein